MKNLFWILSFAVVISFSAQAKTTEVPVAAPINVKPETPVIPAPIDSVDPEGHNVPLPESRARRTLAKYFAMGTYSILDLVIPNKYGFTIGQVRNPDKTWELEYVRGSLSVPFFVDDLGGMSDERISFMARSYFGNSFHLSYGLTYFRFSMHLGNDVLGRVGIGGIPTFLDLVQVESLGPHIGLGQRWTLDHHITLGIDWISWAQPLVVTRREAQILNYTSNVSDRDAVDKVVDVFSYFPRFTLFKLQAGFWF